MFVVEKRINHIILIYRNKHFDVDRCLEMLEYNFIRMQPYDFYKLIVEKNFEVYNDIITFKSQKEGNEFADYLNGLLIMKNLEG